MNDWYTLLVVLLALAVQYFLSTRNNGYWGSLLPVAYLTMTIYVHFSGMFDYSVKQLILFGIVGELFLIGYWISGRKIVENKQKKELTKMKAQDI
ncbi:hypothetical protein [Paenibacillus dakarensis]|uniref:hypothetical protein n=1 Tax=Paenibacillus dakarensis TaxID=1527293 RepID=UPI0006D53A64|nr:hypothetical protein [Paenibacillus dakarensis]